MYEIDVWIGLDVGETDHHTTEIKPDAETLLTRGVLDDEKAIERRDSSTTPALVPRWSSISPGRSEGSPSHSQRVAVSASPTCRGS
jgi:hypothetical protein